MKNLVNGILASLVFSSMAHAAAISEVEANNTLLTAQNVENQFSTGNVAAITNSNLAGWEWVSISATGNGSFDYFSFSAQAGQQFVFDIDYGMYVGGSVDTEIGLWHITGGAALWQRDDCQYNADMNSNTTCNVDMGSSHTFDPLVSWTASQAGIYVVGVGEFNSYDNINGFNGNVLDAGDTYTLQISRSVAVPVAPTMALFGLALAGIGFLRQRKAA